jgi:tRNA (pseudouridine54-N1)-methyltransferase
MSVTFLIPSQTIRTNTKKTIKSVVGGLERVDVLSRCLLNLSRWNRRLNSEIDFILFLSNLEEQQAFTIPISSLELDFKSEVDSTQKLIEILSTPEESGVSIENLNFSDLIKKISKDSKLYYLKPDGSKITELMKKNNQNENSCFVLGSQYDLIKEQEDLLSKMGATRISVGKKDYLASHVITIVCHHMLLRK